MAEDKREEKNDVIEKMEELSDEELEKVAGAVKKTCPPGFVLVGNSCVKK